MKHKRIVVSVVISILLVLTVLHIIKAMKGEQKPSVLAIEQYPSDDLPVHATSDLQRPFDSNKAIVTNASNTSPSLECVSQWLDDVLTVNETVRCIAGYANRTNT